MIERETEASLKAKYPAIPWDEPMPIAVTDKARALGCRICIAIYGLKASDVGALPQTVEEFQRHRAEVHA